MEKKPWVYVRALKDILGYMQKNALCGVTVNERNPNRWDVHTIDGKPTGISIKPALPRSCFTLPLDVTHITPYTPPTVAELKKTLMANRQSEKDRKAGVMEMKRKARNKILADEKAKRTEAEDFQGELRALNNWIPTILHNLTTDKSVVYRVDLKKNKFVVKALWGKGTNLKTVGIKASCNTMESALKVVQMLVKDKMDRKEEGQGKFFDILGYDYTGSLCLVDFKDVLPKDNFHLPLFYGNWKKICTEFPDVTVICVNIDGVDENELDTHMEYKGKVIKGGELIEVVNNFGIKKDYDVSRFKLKHFGHNSGEKL